MPSLIKLPDKDIHSSVLFRTFPAFSQGKFWISAIFLLFEGRCTIQGNIKKDINVSPVSWDSLLVLFVYKCTFCIYWYAINCSQIRWIDFLILKDSKCPYRNGSPLMAFYYCLIKTQISAGINFHGYLCILSSFARKLTLIVWSIQPMGLPQWIIDNCDRNRNRPHLSWTLNQTSAQLSTLR